jgi:hypothetical protein
MRKILLLLLAVVTTFCVNAQNAANYVFSTAANGSLASDMNSNLLDMSTGTSTMIGAGVFGGASETREMGFEFWYMGTRCNTFNATSNGVIGLQANNSLIANSATALASSTGNRIVVFQNGVIAANMMPNLANGKVHTKLFGTEGSFVRVVEWLNMSLNNTSATADATFQLRLYQATGTIEFVYGAMNIGFGGPYTTNAGFSTTTTAFQSINFSSHTSGFSLANNSLPNGTITSLNSTVDGSRRVYRYTPALPNAATGLNFTAVTANGGTLNWTDNSSDEVGFAIYRSIDGGATYKFFTPAAANATSSALTGLLLPNTNYMWRVFTIREFLATPISGTLTTLTNNTITSTAVGGNWSAPGTWVGGVVPVATDNVIISDGSTVTFDATNSCANLTVGQGGATSVFQYHGGAAVTLTISGSLTIASNGQVLAPSSGSIVAHALAIGGANNVHSSGSIINNGILDLNIGTAGVACNLFGRIDGSLSGSGVTNDFYSITVNKGSASLSLEAMFDVTIPITMSSPATSGTRLTLTSGTFRLSSASTITPYFGSQTIGAAASRFWINHASASVSCVGSGTNTGAGTATLSGELRIDNGSFAYGSGNNSISITTSGGALRMNGGNLTIYGRILVSSNSLAQFVQHGGTITIDPQAGNNLATSSSLLSVDATATCVLGGGDIVIVDPHSATGGTAVSFTGGGTKAVFGGNLKIGDGISTSSGGTLDNACGFGLSLGFPVYNLIIDNRTDASTSRMARLLGTSNVNNNLTVNANGFLFLGSGTTQQQLNVRGTSIANSGTISGNHPTGSATPVGILAVQSYSGNPAVTISGAGSYNRLPTLLIENYTSNAVAITTTSTLKVNRTSLFTGQLNPANLSIGNASAIANENPTLQFGGAAPAGLYLAGTFTTAPTIDETEGLRTLIYSSSNATHIMGSNSEIGTGDQRVTELRLINALGLTIPANRTITIANTINSSATLNMTLGNIDLSGGTLTLGFSATQSGLLTYTAGNIQNGTLTRWFPSAPTAVPTTIANGNAGHFPVGSSTGFNRHFWMAFSASPITTGGTVSVTHNAVGGLTTIPSFVDDVIAVDTRTNSNWVVSQSGLDLGANTITTRIQGTNTATVTAFANLRQIRATDAVGSSSNGTNTNGDPQVNRIALDIINFVNTYYIGGNAADLSTAYNSITTGAWENPTTWDVGGSAPLATSLVNISNTHTVTVNLAAATAGTVNINSGGTLAVSGNTLDVTGAATTGINTNSGGSLIVSGGTVNVGVGGFNRRLTSTGILTISSGTLNINGNLSVPSGTFNQSGGNINVDGNNEGVNDVASGTVLVRFGSGVANNGVVSGGNLYIIDPPFTGTSRSLELSFTSGNWQWSANHTTYFGDGVSTNTSTNASGFQFDTYAGSANTQSMIGSLIINGGNATNRWATTTSAGGTGSFVKGNLTINSGSELRDVSSGGVLVVAGNIINNGTFTRESVGLTLADYSGSVLIHSVNAQTISGSGTFRNSIAAPTAQFLILTVNNVNTAGVTFGTGISSPTLSGALTVTNGSLNANDLSFVAGSAQAIALTAATSSINVTNLIINKSAGTASLTGSGFVNVTGTVTPTLGTLAAGGRLVLKSTLSGTARIAQGTGSYISGNVITETYIPGGRRAYRFLGHPFTTAQAMSSLTDDIFVTGDGTIDGSGSSTGAGFDATLTNDPSSFWFENITNIWKAFTTAADASWAQHRGTRVLVRGARSQATALTGGNPSPLAVTLDMTGAVNTGAQNINLPTANNFHLISNPYPSPTDIGTVIDAATNIGTTYWVWDANAVTRGAYVPLTKGGGAYNLAMNGAFFVQPSDATNLAFTETNKVAAATANLFRTQATPNQLELQVNYNGTYADKLFVRNSTTATAGKELTEDGNKLMNPEVNVYTLASGNEALTLDARPIASTTVIPMGFTSSLQSSFEIALNSNTLNNGLPVVLKDKFLNVEHVLTASSPYNFTVTSNAASQGTNRFELVFRTAAALPTTFVNVAAQQKGAAIEVTFNTANETNMHSYEVEESKDGSRFTKGITLEAKNAATNNYSWLDLNVNNGNNYYRVKANEKNGTVKYSQVVRVNIGTKRSEFTVYPNPVKGGTINLQLTDIEKGVYTIKVVNNLGQEIAAKQITHNGGSANQTISIGNAPTGKYNMIITDGTTTVTKTVIVE